MNEGWVEAFQAGGIGVVLGVIIRQVGWKYVARYINKLRNRL